MASDKRAKYFSVDAFSVLAAAEAGNWWFRSRNRLILWTLDRYCQPIGSFLEIGCGTGFVLEGVHRAYGEAKLFGSEYFEEGLNFARERVPSAEFFRLDATQMTDVGVFDVVGAFDVLEHIDEDERVLSNVFNAIKTGGFLIVTVPQHRWLWSPVDDYACHVRRYTRGELVGKIKAAGFDVVQVSSFVSLLLPLMWISRLLSRTKSVEPMSEFSIPGWLNRVLEAVMSLERRLIAWGLRFPAGGSLIVVGRKNRYSAQ